MPPADSKGEPALHVVELISGLAWSGGQQQVLLLASGLAARGHRVTICCERGGELEERARATGLEVVGHRMRHPFDPVLFGLLLGLVRRSGAQLVDVHRAGPQGTAMLARAFWGRAPLVATRRVSFAIPTRLSARVKYDLMIDGLVAVSDAVRESLLGSGVPQGKIRVIRGAVDTARFRPGLDPLAARAELGIPPGARLLLVAANYSTWKGHAWFLRLVPAIAARWGGSGPLRAVIAGLGTDGVGWTREIARLGLEGVVLGVGFRRDVERLMAAADVVVCPSLEGEGMAGSLREAMAMEVPVVATAAGGNGELVVDGRTGRLVPPGNGPAMVEACLKALERTPEGENMAAEARRLVLERYTVERMARETESFYRGLVAKRLGSGEERP